MGKGIPVHPGHVWEEVMAGGPEAEEVLPGKEECQDEMGEERAQKSEGFRGIYIFFSILIDI